MILSNTLRLTSAILLMASAASAFAQACPSKPVTVVEQGLEPVPNSPAQASQLVAAGMQRWEAVVKAAGIKAD